MTTGKGKGNTVTCHICSGSGTVAVPVGKDAKGNILRRDETCKTCKGRGVVWTK